MTDHFQLTESKGQNSRILKPSKVPYTNQIKGKILAQKQKFRELPIRSILEINLQPDSKLTRKTAGKGKRVSEKQRPHTVWQLTATV